MEKKAIKLNYRSAERFSKVYALLKKGKIFLPSKTFLPIKTTLVLNFTVPEIENVFTVTGVVVKILDEQIAAQFNKPTGMLLAVVGGSESILKELSSTLGTNKKYQNMLGLTQPAAVKEAPENKPSSSKTETPVAPAEPSVDTVPVSQQPDNDLKDLDEVSPEEDGKADLTLDWLRKAVAQEEVVREDIPKPEITIAPTTEKKDLTLEERKKN